MLLYTQREHMFSGSKHWDSAGCHELMIAVHCPLSTRIRRGSLFFPFPERSTCEEISCVFKISWTKNTCLRHGLEKKKILDEMKQRKDAINRAKLVGRKSRKSLSNAYLLPIPFLSNCQTTEENI